MELSKTFSEKVVIITGASAGIGAETAKLFAKRGAKLVLHGRREQQLDQVAAECEALSGTKPLCVLGEIENEKVRKKLITATISRFGQIDVLFNNAGYVIMSDVDHVTTEHLRTMMECHTIAPFDLSLKAIPHLEKTNGCIINNSSLSADRVMTDIIAYATAKAALNHMTKCLAIGCAKKGIRINAVAPGVIATEISRDFGPGIDVISEQFAESLHAIPRIGKPEDIAEVVVFMASEACSLMTATIVPVDGGAHARGPTPPHI